VSSAAWFGSLFWILLIGGVLVWNFVIRERPTKERTNYAPQYNKDAQPPDLDAAKDDISKMDSESEYLRKIVEAQAENDALYGKTDKYEWKQGEHEVELWFPVDAAITRKNVKLEVSNKRIGISINGSKIVEGSFYADIIAEDSNWQFEEADGTRRFVFTAPKREPTKRNQHWRSMLKGDATIGACMIY
jgi:hypothetical protein